MFYPGSFLFLIGQRKGKLSKALIEAFGIGFHEFSVGEIFFGLSFDLGSLDFGEVKGREFGLDEGHGCIVNWRIRL